MTDVHVRSRRLLPSLALAVSALAASGAMAQNVPASVNPAQVQKRFEPAPMPLDSSALDLPIPGKPKALSKQVEAQLAKKRFVLKHVKIEGAKAYSDDQLKFAYDSLIGKQISMLDAQLIARKISDFYQNNGYVLSQAVIPQQEISGGTLKVRVVEGYVDSVAIEGDISDSEKRILTEYASHIQKSHPARMQDMERSLLLMNDLPGSTVRGVLRPSHAQFGAADLVLIAKEKPFNFNYSIDNRGSKYIGPWQENASVTANSLFGLYDRTSLRLTSSLPFDEMKGIELQHEELLGSDGTRLLLLGSHTHTNPGDSLKQVHIVGDSDTLEAKVVHPFIRSRQENLVGRVLFDYNDVDTDVFHNVDFTEDKLSVARIGGTYSFFDGWNGNNLFDLQYSQGLNIFGATDSGTNRSNAIGEADFRKFNADISRSQPLPNNFSLYAAASGQYSLDPLLVSEQFSVGGSSFGGAYDPAELLGDQGIAGKIEARYNGDVGARYFNAYQLFTYYDIGRVWLRDVGPGVNDKKSLASIGGGIRTSFTENISSSLEIGVPMTKPASNQGRHGNDPRIFFGTTASF